MFKFYAGIVCGELPADIFLLGISLRIPCFEFFLQLVNITDAAFRQALVSECR